MISRFSLRNWAWQRRSSRDDPARPAIDGLSLLLLPREFAIRHQEKTLCKTAPRMSKAVVHGDTVYLAGIVADSPKGKNMTEQVKSILSQIDGLFASAGTDKSKLLSANI